MNKVQLLLVIIIIVQQTLYIFYSNHSKPSTPQYVSTQQLYVWPHPRVVKLLNTKKYVIQNYKTFELIVSGSAPVKHFFEPMIQKYKQRIFYDKKISYSDCEKCVRGLRIRVYDTSQPTYPSVDMDEEYSLLIDSEKEYFELNANSVWGALRGLETFSQLVTIDHSMQKYVTQNVEIHDAPRFKWRGLLIDTARHYLTVEKIFHILDGMSYLKLNTLHWHITDSESFPIVIPKRPLLSKLGAYSPRAVYTPDDVKKVVEYARFRGIRVVPEIDHPAHTQSWGKAYPNLMINVTKETKDANNMYMIENCEGYPLLNIAKKETYDVIEDIVDGLSKMFPDEYIHTGGDEVNYECWYRDPQARNPFDAPSEAIGHEKLKKYYYEKLSSMFNARGKKMVFWSDAFYEHQQPYFYVKPPKSSISQVWKHPTDMFPFIWQDYQVLLSSGWYLDHLNRGWRDMYNVEPFEYMSERIEQDKVLGGEACAWGEHIDNTNFDNIVYPRLAATAERLWSPKEIVLEKITERRIANLRCLLLRRGIQAAPAGTDTDGKCEQS